MKVPFGRLFWSALLLQAVVVKGQDSTLPVTSQLFRQQYDWLRGQTLTQPFLSTKTYGMLEAGYRVTGGEYRLSQDADRQRAFFFHTEGSKKIRKALVSGAFTFTKTMQDSVANTLRYGLKDPVPYYFFALQKGNWQITQYKLDGAVSHAFAHDKLTVGAGVQYDVGNAWRNNDPRVSQFFFDLRAQASMHYRFLPLHTLGIAGGLLKKNSENSNDYLLSDHQDNIQEYPQYINHLSMGYGFTMPFTQNIRINTNRNGWTLQGVYRGQFNFGNITATGNYERADARFLNKPQGNEAGLDFGKYDEEIIRASLLWQHATTHSYWSALAEYDYQYGTDLNTLLNGNNYIYLFEKVNIQPMYGHLQHGRLQYEIGMDAGLANQLRIDGTAGHRAEYQYLDLGLKGAYYFYLQSPAKILKALMGISLRKPLEPALTVQPQQENFFTRAVVYPDYYYYSADVLGAQLQLQYQFPVRKTNAFIRCQSQFQFANVANGSFKTTTTMGNTRWSFQCSAGIIL